MSSIPAPPDEALLDAFRAGDASAFEALLNRYRTSLFNYLFRMTRNRAEAEELFQDVFLKVVERADEFRGESRFATWLYAIARNRSIDHSRRMSFRRHQSLDTTNSPDGVPRIEKIPSPRRTERRTEERLVEEKIGEAVESLPDDQREVFLLRQVQGLSFKEIAIVVDAPVNTVKSRMRYALERLQEALADYRDYARELG